MGLARPHGPELGVLCEPPDHLSGGTARLPSSPSPSLISATLVSPERLYGSETVLHSDLMSLRHLCLTGSGQGLQAFEWQS